MLVLTRKANERIQIGADVSITITRIKGKTIQLGIEAPKHIKVLRGELLKENSKPKSHAVAGCSTQADACDPAELEEAATLLAIFGDDPQDEQADHALTCAPIA